MLIFSDFYVWLFFIHFNSPWFFQSWLSNQYMLSHLFSFFETWLFSFLNYMHILFVFGYIHFWLLNRIFYYSYRLLNIYHYFIFYCSIRFLLWFRNLCICIHIKYYISYWIKAIRLIFAMNADHINNDAL
jgi:hypothetical protein